MSELINNKLENNSICMGILAHVDAGKTTLAESLMYVTGQLSKPGRVDHKDAFLDIFQLEKDRGITIFSKQARLTMGDKSVTIMDTPGHSDFSAEMERALQVLDYAVLLVSAADGVTGQVQTLWKLLERYNVPVFIFVNKMDQQGANQQQLMMQLKKLYENCFDFTKNIASIKEDIAMCDEAVLESYLETGTLETRDICALIKQRKLVPCYFGSALKIQGIDILIKGLSTYMMQPEYGQDFGARVYKIARDENGQRLTYMKITGGSLKVKMPVGDEKVNQIRLYSGVSYEAVQQVDSGTICAVSGLNNTYAGQGLGVETEAQLPLLVPLLHYRMILPEETDVYQVYLKLGQLEEEEPEINMLWQEETGEIQVRLMGEVQIDVLKTLIKQRFDLDVDFGQGRIIYKETIGNTVEGVGHFEPLRHYAEVHLIMEPMAKDSGLVFESHCPTDVLDRHWQRLILNHLEEKSHIGVLTGSAITDMKITLVSGKAHAKHTEGGDFRQATYRAVRQGLFQAESIVLEPMYTFYLEVPSEMVGRAMSDILQRHGQFEAPEVCGDMSILKGQGPVATLQQYSKEVISYTKGKGKFSCTFNGYEPCHNQEEVIASLGYDGEADVENTGDSVFCTHGAGFIVPWYNVKEYMHIDSCLESDGGQEKAVEPLVEAAAFSKGEIFASDEELDAIFRRTYGDYEKDKNQNRPPVQRQYGLAKVSEKRLMPKKPYLLVDGYNIIFSWPKLKALSESSMDGARSRLADILCNYQGYTQVTVILVFDAYKVVGGEGSVIQYKNIHIVYTKEAETADQYIEKSVHNMGKDKDIVVATSDYVEQVIIMGQGARRMSAEDLRKEILRVEQHMTEEHLSQQKSGQSYIFDQMPEEMKQLVEKMRLGENDTDEFTNK